MRRNDALLPWTEAAEEASPEEDPAVGGAKEGAEQVETKQPATKKQRSSALDDLEERMPGQLPQQRHFLRITLSARVMPFR